jgi:hypothetical protein
MTQEEADPILPPATSIGGIMVEARAGMLASEQESIALFSLGLSFDGNLLWPGQVIR